MSEQMSRNPKDDAVQLQINGDNRQNPLQLEEQYG